MRPAVALANVDKLFAVAERAVALLDRCRPMNAARETERVMEAWDAGRPTVPRYEYAPAPALASFATALESVVAGAEAAGPWGKLYAARAHELLGEIRVVESIGSKTFRDRARDRFPVDDGPFGRRARAVAVDWSRLGVDDDGPSIRSDDEANPESLISTIRSLVGERRLPIRIVATSDLPCAAATGDGVVYVQTGVRHRPSCARRIALHEVLGHALPRHRAKAERLGLFTIGTALGSEDEEGRALVIEDRHSLLENGRRRDLGVRHLAALAVRDGADFVELVRLSMGRGFSARESVRVASRVDRGGGLAREIVYLTARERVLSAFASDRRLEGLLERGRIGVDAGRKLIRLGAAPTVLHVSGFENDRRQRNVATTGV